MVNVISQWLFARSFTRLMTLSLLIPLSAPLHAEQGQQVNIKPFSATYALIHKSDTVGKGIRKLERTEDNLWRYSYSTDIEWLIFSDKRSELSVVNINDHQVSPIEYHFEREGTGRDKEQHLKFDYSNNQLHDVDSERSFELPLDPPVQDKLSYHLQHRLTMQAHPEQRQYVYAVTNNTGKVKNYVYQYDGEEEIMLPYGLVKTIRLKREVTEKKRITYAWFAPEHDYLLVKLYQEKSGVKQFEAQLTELSYP